MAENKMDQKVAKVDVKAVVADREGLAGSLVSHSAELAERAATTAFGIARDVRGEINQRVLGTLQWLEGSQQGVFKLLRTVDERIEKLAEDVVDVAENVTLGFIRTVRDAGRGVTDLAANLTRPSEVSRAA